MFLPLAVIATGRSQKAHAAMIVKGAREAVYGYKVQVGRDEHDLVVAMRVCEGKEPGQASVVDQATTNKRRSGTTGGTVLERALDQSRESGP